MLSPSCKALPFRSLSAALGLSLGLAMPTAANACSFCADAASRVTQPGVLDAGRVLLWFFVASAALMLYGRISGAEWRLQSKGYWVVGAAAVIGGFKAATTGLTLAAGPPLIVVSLMRVYRAVKLPKPSSRELLAALLAGLFLVSGPAVFLIGNQRASSLDYLFSTLAAGHPVTAKQALKALRSQAEAPAVACDRLDELNNGIPGSQESRPMEWFGLMTLAESTGSCPEAVLSLQRRCLFPDDAKMDTNLSCEGTPKD